MLVELFSLFFDAISAAASALDIRDRAKETEEANEPAVNYTRFPTESADQHAQVSDGRSDTFVEEFVTELICPTDHFVFAVAETDLGWFMAQAFRAQDPEVLHSPLDEAHYLGPETEHPGVDLSDAVEVSFEFFDDGRVIVAITLPQDIDI
ncbi:MAG: hypothetical protein AAGG57_03035 [Pseudomonadota bacterium]